MSESHTAYFSESYPEARARFLERAKQGGATLDSLTAQAEKAVNPEPFTDTALIGPTDAACCLVVVSGTHGPEGLTGSACQQALLADIHAHGLPADTSVLLVHAINAWGVATGLRCTEEGVDLNRNYAEFDGDTTALEASNAEYDAMHAFLHGLADTESAQRFVAEGPARLGAEFGEDAVNILFQGQHRHADGAGFGGFRPTAARRRLEQATAQCLSKSEAVAVVDLHTGLGPHAVGMKFSVAEGGSEAAMRATRWYGDDVVQINDPDSNLPYRVFGDTSVGVARALPRALVTGLTLEYGTYEVDGLVRCILSEFLMRHRPEVLDDYVAEQLTRDIGSFFYPTDNAWRERVIGQARVVFSQALAGLLE